MRLDREKRRGIALVEFAIVSSVTSLVLLGLFIGCMGIFRYQQVAALARETARYASLHGAESIRGTGDPLPTDDDIYQKVIVPRATLLNLSKFTYLIEWAEPNRALSYLDPATNQYVPNTVTVTITYEWKPELFLGSITLSSTSVATVSN